MLVADPTLEDSYSPTPPSAKSSPLTTRKKSLRLSMPPDVTDQTQPPPFNEHEDKGYSTVDLADRPNAKSAASLMGNGK
ncbi:hypothetical protein HK097_001895, partial [Rhizophlyctis rosea]